MKDDWIETDIERVRQKDKYGYIDMASGQMDRSLEIVIDIREKTYICLAQDRLANMHTLILEDREIDRNRY